MLPFQPPDWLPQVARKLSDDGLAGENTGGKVVLINPKDCLILLGSVVGCFEGIGLVLPIQVRWYLIVYFHRLRQYIVVDADPALGSVGMSRCLLEAGVFDAGMLLLLLVFASDS